MKMREELTFSTPRILCMIEHIPEMIEAGIDSFKIEGRMKTGAVCRNGCKNIPPCD